MTTEPEILFERVGRAGLITLNRPKALNALTLDMVRLMHPQLADWAADPAVERVVVRAAGDKAFCAGGDIRNLYNWGRENDPRFLAFYREEYRLNTFIKRYPKPYVALIDGIVMGGGVGVSVHGSHRIAGDRTVFAMPETGIGLFPDVGGTYFLPRLPGFIGTWLALTGSRLKQAGALEAGVATHAAATGDFANLTDLVCNTNALDKELDSFCKAPDSVSELDSKSEAAPESLSELQGVIDRCFSADTVEAILDRLESETGAQAEWAGKQASIMRTKSPTSQKIALRQMRDGARADFETCMKIEFRIVSRILHGHEFFEGIRAVIVDKDNAPAWRPETLAEISESDIECYFAPLGPDELDLSGLDTID